MYLVASNCDSQQQKQTFVELPLLGIDNFHTANASNQPAKIEVEAEKGIAQNLVPKATARTADNVSRLKIVPPVNYPLMPVD